MFALMRHSFQRDYNGGVIGLARGPGLRRVSTPSAVFALAFVLLGWIASHTVAYGLVGLLPDGHHHGEEHVHGYMSLLKSAGGLGLVAAFGMALRFFFRHGSFGEWLHEGGVAGTRNQIMLATTLPAGVFVLVEHLERMAAGTGTLPSAKLLAVGVLVQFFVGLACLALARFAFRVAEEVIRYLASGRLVHPERQPGRAVMKDVVLPRPPCPISDARSGRPPPFSSSYHF